jgi:hypothetical protein
VAGNGYGFGYVMKVAGTGIQRCYPQIVYPLPSLDRRVETSNSCVRILILDFFSFIVFFVKVFFLFFAPFSFFGLVFYCLFSFLIWFCIALRFLLSFALLFCPCFLVHVVSFLAYPNLLVTKMLGCCCCTIFFISS